MKRFTATLLSLILVLSLAACDKTSNVKTENETEETVETTTKETVEETTEATSETTEETTIETTSETTETTIKEDEDTYENNKYFEVIDTCEITDKNGSLITLQVINAKEDAVLGLTYYVYDEDGTEMFHGGTSAVITANQKTYFKFSFGENYDSNVNTVEYKFYVKEGVEVGPRDACEITNWTIGDDGFIYLDYVIDGDVAPNSYVKAVFYNEGEIVSYMNLVFTNGAKDLPEQLKINIESIDFEFDDIDFVYTPYA